MTAATALHFGLVNEVAPDGDIDRRVAAWTDDLLRSAPLSVQAIKEAVLRSLDRSLAESFMTRYPCEERRMYSRDAREGPRAFVEKRNPVWSGT
jgi:crotonobetainyl-CoA hydratase/dehydration protein DpgD